MRDVNAANVAYTILLEQIRQNFDSDEKAATAVLFSSHFGYQWDPKTGDLTNRLGVIVGYSPGLELTDDGGVEINIRLRPQLSFIPVSITLKP